MKSKFVIKILPLFLLIIIISCKNNIKEKKETPLASGVLTEYMDTSVKPGDNFTSYVNGTWMKNTEIPSDKSAYGIGYILYEESENHIKEIIEESASKEYKKDSDEQKVGDLYKSYMDIETRNKLGVSPLQPQFNKVDAIKNYDDLASYFAYANKYGINIPFSLFIYQDFKNPTIYRMYTWQDGLGLPDREYYLKDDERSKQIRIKYTEHISKMFALANLPNAEKASSIIMSIETALAEKHLKKEKTRDLVNLYNMFSTDSLSIIMPNYNWDTYLNEAGLKNEKKLGVLMLDYMKALDKIITSTSISNWKIYLKWHILNKNASKLNDDISNQNFEFYSKELRDIPQQRPLWRRGVTIVNDALGEVVGKVYVKKHFPPEAKKRMEALVTNLLKAYEQSIKELDWMSDDTKKEALDKLNKFMPKIGYPDKWKTYDVDIKADDLFGNLQRAALIEYNRAISKLGQPIDKTEWDMTPQTVNAYYNPTLNEIVFPAAILQPPFFDLNVEDAVNYGGIGAVIGHEIGHGFDDMGSTFDGDGAMRNWWTEKDKEEFKKRTSTLVSQYNSYEALPGLNVNGEFTLGENIGDLGGLSIALKAYKISLNGKEPPVIDGFSGEQRVFIGWAQSWRSKSRAEALRVQINTDEHSPAKFRVNGVVRNIPEFYSAFNIQENDSLYLPPEKRVKIW
ncbi:M13 family metallopeptidase [Polaribacter sargassicola]|uniref:M13 family metallopeptidase n=1 Tax=Polaribacter sargassicola TaxID=2836891 RepID=UPI001F1A8068|nr:M13-type metalloendopeptidase [Polaribacter sp. DS7-9]MCG1034795.1 M13 family peptidase [Polaribacter sp. DS7-9]